MYLLGVLIKLFGLIFPYFLKFKYFIIILILYSIGCLLFHSSYSDIFWFDFFDLAFFVAIYGILYFPSHWIIKKILPGLYEKQDNRVSYNNHNSDDEQDFFSRPYEQQSLLDRHSKLYDSSYNKGYESDYYNSEGMINYDKVSEEINEMENNIHDQSSSNS